MFSVVRNATVGAATLALAAGFSPPAQAAYTVTLLQQGPNVVGTGSGSIDLADITFDGSDAIGSQLVPNEAFVFTGAAANEDSYRGIAGPRNFGIGNQTNANSSSGDIVGVAAFATGSELVEVPHGYASGNLSNTATYAGQSFVSLGVTPGIYVWTWGTGAHADSFTLQIGTVVAAPEPTSLALFGVSLAGLGMVLRTRRA